jgi:subfamily B ATP-binding cassette protein MsbA
MSAENRENNLLRFLAYVKPYKWLLVLAIIGGIVKFVTPLLMPQVTRHLIDNVFLNETMTHDQKTHELLIWAGGMAAIFLFVFGPWTYIRHYMAGKVGQRSVFDLRCDLYYRILRMSASFFDRNKTGEIVSRLISDIALAQNLVGNALTNIWMDAVSLVLILYFLFSIDTMATFVALSTFPLYIVFFKKFGSRIKTSSKKVQQEIAEMSGNISEKVSGSTVVHAFTGEKHEEKKFFEDSEKLFSTAMKRTYFQSMNMTFVGLVTHLAPLVVILYGGYRTITGTMTVGDIIAIIMYLGPLYTPLRRFSELNVVFANSMAALDRIFEVMDQKPEIRSRPGAVKLENATGRVEFSNVSFAYEPDAEPVIKHIDFTAEPGTKVALVGPSGSGKSTLAGLVPRFYDATGGTVMVDGHDVRDLKVGSLRRNVGIVLQDPILFSGSIWENILYGKPHASKKEVVEASRAANAFEFIKELPAGFATEVGERGHFLSGGQKQRITLARAFLKDPKILILDEATSSLDAESESLVQDALKRLMANRTTFIIAHRLATILNVDRILVLENGRIIEDGTHNRLVETGGLYSELYDKQFNQAQAVLSSK